MYDRDAPQEQAHGRFVAATHHIKKQKHAQYHSHDPYGQHRWINPLHPPNPSQPERRSHSRHCSPFMLRRSWLEKPRNASRSPIIGAEGSRIAGSTLVEVPLTGLFFILPACNAQLTVEAADPMGSQTYQCSECEVVFKVNWEP